MTTENDTLVYAVKCNGEDYFLVARTDEDLALLRLDLPDYDFDAGQCENCGSFNQSGEPVAYTLERNGAYCQGCGRHSRIVLKPASEVVFA